MSTSHGYVTEIAYTSYFFDEMAPVYINYVGALNGFRPVALDEGFSYLELGCGTGLTTNTLAAIHPQGHFVGVDLNGEHTRAASDQAAKGGLANTEFIEASFDQFLRTKPPRFDFIALHGVYSWVPIKVRQQVQRIISRHLKPGGLVYVSYNTLPGAWGREPLRRILQTYAAGLKGDLPTRARQALAYAQHLQRNGAAYFAQNKVATTTLETLLKCDIRYVIHEYFNECWNPMYFGDVAEEMKSAGVRFAGNIPIHLNYPEVSVPNAFRPLMNSAASRELMETHKDFVRAEIFRKDVFAKAKAPLAMSERLALFEDMSVGSLFAADAIKDKVVLPSGIGVNYNQFGFAPLMQHLAHGSHSIREVCAAFAKDGDTRDSILKKVQLLIAGGQFMPLANAAPAREIAAHGRYQMPSVFTRTLVRDSWRTSGNTPVALPRAGTALRIDGVETLLLDACLDSSVDEAVETAVRRVHTHTGPIKIRADLVKGDEARRVALAKVWDDFRPRLRRLVEFGALVEADPSAVHRHDKVAAPA